jgi:CubicO group peptidase (beta-lactamase class C family)
MKKRIASLVTLISSFCLNAQSLYFPPLTGNTWETLSPTSLNWCSHRIDSLYAFLDASNTKAFILLKDGKIVLEKYFGTHTAATPWQWASAGKAITSFMVGMASQENYLSLADTVSHYLGQGWTSCSPAQEEKITIRHQLTMTSGLDDGVQDNFCTLDTCLVYKADPGLRWAYHNAPYTLLDTVIESATGQSLNMYTTQKLKNPTGMTGAFVPVGYNQVYFSNARSMARFGLLILNKGNWNGSQLMTDTTYFKQMVQTSQLLNEAYGYLWWLNGKSSYRLPATQLLFNGPLCPSAPSDMIAAMGKDGQFLNVVPGENLVWVRMGNSPDNLPVPFLLNDRIWSYVRELGCQPLGLSEHGAAETFVRLFPNPAGTILNIQAAEEMSGLEILSVQGSLLRTEALKGHARRMSVADLAPGLYGIRITLSGGRQWTGKFARE